jgi:hypothetical protein
MLFKFPKDNSFWWLWPFKITQRQYEAIMDSVVQDQKAERLNYTIRPNFMEVCKTWALEKALSGGIHQVRERYSNPFFCKIEKVSLRFPCPNIASQQAMLHHVP